MLNELWTLVLENKWLLTVSLAMGGLGAWAVSRYAEKIDLLDRPNERSSHFTPTPKGGGIGILITFILGGFILGFSTSFLIPLMALSLVSLAGDKIDISPTVRLAVQFIAAFIVLYSLNNHESIALLGHLNNLMTSFSLFSLAAVFIVGTANFYNFMDGINGIAGLTGIVAFLLLALYGFGKGVFSEWVLLCLCLVMSCIGFLPFNFPHARVFMGDVGSVLLGFLFASVVLVTAESFMEFILLASFMFPFYADELVTMAERIKDGWSLTKPHRRHFYQVLANEAHIPHWKVSTGYALFQFLAGIIFWKAFEKGIFFFISALLAFSALFLLVNFKVKRRYRVLSLQRTDR